MARRVVGQSPFQHYLSFFRSHSYAVGKCADGFGYPCQQAFRTDLCSTALDDRPNAESKELKRMLKEELKQRVKERYYKDLHDYRNRKPPTPEEMLLQNIEKARRKVAWTRQMLIPFQLLGDQPANYDPEILTSEQLHYVKKIGRKNQNYVPVGKRGIYGGTIQNMHLNWKKHETVQIDCHMFPFEQVNDMAEDLAKLSGGIVIEIIKDKKIIILYRGKNYVRPENIIPKNTLDKRKALKKALYEKSMYAVLRNITRLEEQLRVLRQTMAHDIAANSLQQQCSLEVENSGLHNQESSVVDNKLCYKDEPRHESSAVT
ncbi:hypothetical protein O6H91_07G088500 [Diphasiastrum complanatum]|uniref:Uncharacterized protein n=1 Tax=Diphasiastrum complanatum TaxID=34168 RepID=A0ACC2D7F3_DIPCM|nr:hypothetical protein O6H91_07G088500 [Diphasiastrum complanatum]